MIYTFDDFELDAARLELRRAGAVLKVDRVVLRVLAVLLRGAGRLVTKDELVAEVWDGRATTDNVLTVSMARLRRALDDRRGKQECVVTIYGLGYRFVRPVTAQPPRSESEPLLASVGVATDGEPPLVGRAALLAELRRGVGRARAGRGRLYALTGEAGVGKTCVVQALTDELVGVACHTAWGFCLESGSTPPLHPWLQLLRKLLASDVATAWEADHDPIVGELRQLLGQGEAGSDGSLTPIARSVELIARAFVRAAETLPCVLVLENLHRADAASLEVLSALVDELGRTRLLILATLRCEMAPGRPLRPGTALPYVLGHSNTERVAIRRLSEADVVRYVAASVRDLEGGFGRAIYEKSQGNPFLMKELIGQLRREDVRTPEQLSFSSAALDIVRQRVAGLPDQARQLLDAAAVAGTRFELPILQAVTGQSSADLTRALDDAIAADLVVATPDSPTAFSFEHDLIRTALYEDMTLAERRRRHLATAHAIEQHAAEAHLAMPVGELADHFYAAMPETDLDKTVRYSEQAARVAGVAFAHVDAARHLRHALSALALVPSATPSQRADLLLGLALYTRGSAPELSQSSLQEVVRLARESRDARRLIRGGMMYHVHPEFSSMPGGTAALEHALTLISEDEPGLRATALASLATAAPRAYSDEERSACLLEAERLARRAPRDECLQVVLTCKLFSEFSCDDADGEAVMAELDHITKKRPQRTPVVPLFITVHRTVRSLQRGKLDAAYTSIDRGKARARAVRHPELLWYFERFEALAKINEGACEEGRASLLRLHRQVAQRPIMGGSTFCAFDRAVVLPELGVATEVDDALRRELVFQAWDAPGVWALKLRALVAAEMLDEARSSLTAIPAYQLAELPRDSQYLGTLGHLARAVRRLGARDYAVVIDGLLAPLECWFAAHASFYCEGPVPLLRGIFAREQDRLDEARTLLELAVQMSDRAGFVLPAAEARLELASCLRALDHAKASKLALKLATEAGAIAARHGLTRMAQRAARQLAEASESELRETGTRRALRPNLAR